MRAMKDSGTVWLGTIPANWDIARIGSFYRLRNTKVSDTDYPPLSVTNKGIVPQLETAAKTNAHDDRKLVKKGDFAINSRSDRRGSCGIAPCDGSVSLINTILSPMGEMNPRYYDWLFHTIEFGDEFYKCGHGIVDDLWTTGWQDMKKIRIPYPSLAEQEKIADVLDSQCSQIDAISADIQKEIEILEQYKRSVITEAVTKGLNPDAEMKDSGAEWIGKIPLNWKLEKGKHLFRQRNSKGNNISLQLLSPSQKYGVIPQTLLEKLTTQNVVKTSERADLGNFKTIHKGDFCISLRSFQGGFEYSEYEGVVSPAYQVFYKVEPLYNNYYRYLFKENSFIKKMNSFTMTLRDGKNIAFSDFGGTYIPVPPLDEQEKIAAFLNKKSSEIDSLVAEKKQQLEVLDSYKKSLIYEYVTGKKEVV